MEETFFFALLRISVAQILKAAGFDKCKPLVLNIVTELYLKHLELVVLQTKKFAVSRTNVVNDVEACDMVEALLNIGFLKPSAASDPHGTKNTKSIESFKNWVQYSDTHAVSRRLNTVPTLLLANLIEKRKIDTSAETDQERKKRRLRERQEYFNQLKQGDDKPERASDLAMDVDEDELTPSDKLSWLAYLAEKDMKLGQNMKFVNTCIQDDLMHVHKLKKYHPTVVDGEDSFVLFKHQIHTSNKNDHVLLQLQEDEKNNDGKPQQQVLPSANLKGILPYNVKYDEYLVDDDLQQYLQYASTHEDEIKARLETLNELADTSPADAKDDDAVDDPTPLHANNSEHEEKIEKEVSPTAGEPASGKEPEMIVETESKEEPQKSPNGPPEKLQAPADDLQPEKSTAKEEPASSSKDQTTDQSPSLEKKADTTEPELPLQKKDKTANETAPHE